MEQLEELKSWLGQFPLWDSDGVSIDDAGAAPGSCGLFPLGITELSRKENVLGGAVVRYRQEFLLRRVAVRSQAAAQWLLQLQNWVANHCHQAPRLGEEQRVYAEKGKLTGPTRSGAATYEVRLRLEYTNYFEGE